MAGTLGTVLRAWFCAAAAALPAQEPGSLAALREPARWQEQVLGEGVVLRRAWFARLFDAPQSLALLVVDLRAEGVRIAPAVPEKLTPTTAQARRAGALAAVNGGFFLPDGKPRGLRRLGGTVVAERSAEPHACVGWDAHGFHFGDNRGDWSAFSDVVEAGPRLVAAGEVKDHGARQRSIRHPRTALGVRTDGALLLLTADGRTETAAGLSLHELGCVMQALGCTDALNLDGGGSSTLWALGFRGGDGSGIGNHPCDDKRFDAAGERAVADVLLVHARALVQWDDGEAAAHEGALRWSGDGSGFLGSGFLWAEAGEEVEVAFRAKVPRGGRYEVQRRAVVAAGVSGATVHWGASSGGERRGGGFSTTSDSPAESAAAWVRVAELRVDPGADVSVTARSVRGRPFVVDAVRIVEMRP